MANLNNSEDLVDPEPISFALEILAALAGTAGLIVQAAQYSRDRSQDQSAVRKHLFAIDRSLNRIDEAYRSLISIYDENNILFAPVALGASPLFVDQKMRAELERLHSNIFYGGRDLQNAMTDLSTYLNRNNSEDALQIVRALDEVFQRARQSKRLLEFMIELGQMLELVTDFVYTLGERYEFQPTSIRITLMRDTVEQLRNRLRRR
jgi:hypothetical protein